MTTGQIIVSLLQIIITMGMGLLVIRSTRKNIDKQLDIQLTTTINKEWVNDVRKLLANIIYNSIELIKLNRSIDSYYKMEAISDGNSINKGIDIMDKLRKQVELSDLMSRDEKLVLLYTNSSKEENELYMRVRNLFLYSMKEETHQKYVEDSIPLVLDVVDQSKIVFAIRLKEGNS